MTDINHDPLAADIQQPENPRAVPGSNKPPEETPADVPADPLVAAALLRVAEATLWLNDHPDATKWDDALAASVNTTIGDVDRAHDNLDGQRLQEGRDFKAEQTRKYSTPLSLLETAKGELVALRRAYLKMMEDRLAEQQRKTQEAAEKARQEAAAAAERLRQDSGPDPLAAELAVQEAAERATALSAKATEVPVKAYVGGSSKATGLRDTWTAEITDIKAAQKHYLSAKNPSRVVLMAAIERAVIEIATREARVTKDVKAAPPGIKFVCDRR